jgi:hypothetical protein
MNIGGIKMPSCGNLVNYLKTNGNDLVGAEVGVASGENLCYILNECSNIKKIHAIDPYLPYLDGDRFVSSQEQEKVKAISDIEIRKYGLENRVKRIYLNSTKAANEIENESLDFIYIDGDHSYEYAYNDMRLYYKKLKKGGIFAGHDYSLKGVNEALVQFTNENNIDFDNELIKLTNDSWFWYKK